MILQLLLMSVVFIPVQDSHSPCDVTLKLLYDQNVQLQKELRDLKSTIRVSERSKQRSRVVVVPTACSVSPLLITHPIILYLLQICVDQ